MHRSSTAQTFIAVRQVIRTAMANGLLRNDVARALDSLAKEGRAISGGNITTALSQIRHPNGARPSTTDQRVAQAQALKAQLQEDPSPGLFPAIIQGEVIR